MVRKIFIYGFVFLSLGCISYGYTQTSSEASFSYINKVSLLQAKVSSYIDQINSAVVVALSQGNLSLRNLLISDLDKVLGVSIDTLNSLTVPLEFKSYHDKISDSYIYRKLAFQALLDNDRLRVRDLNRQADLSDLDALAELKQVFRRLGAPDSMVDNIGRKIINKQKLQY